MSPETRDALLYGQLQEGLQYRLMEAPAVSGAADYQALCLAAKSEEKRLAELKKRRQYQSDPRRISTSRASLQESLKKGDWPKTPARNDKSGGGHQRKMAGRC